MREAVEQTMVLARANKCKNIFCDNTVNSLQHRLDLAKTVVINLTKIIGQ
jgi:hypothetical protein